MGKLEGVTVLSKLYVFSVDLSCIFVLFFMLSAMLKTQRPH